MAWNAAINLTAVRDPVEAVRRHILDSLVAVATLRDRGIDAFVDIGSGGGYPGLPLAAAVPARRALLVDSVGKKARFLATAAAATGLGSSVEAFAGRAETLAADDRHRERWPAVVARAVGSMAELAELGLPLVARDGVLVAWKRGAIDAELEAAGPAITAVGGAPPIVLPAVHGIGLDDHRLVIVAKVRADAGGLPARSGGASAAPALSPPGDATPSAPGTGQRPTTNCGTLSRCGSPSCRTSMRISSRSTPSWPRSARSTPSGISATWSATGPIPTGSSAG